MMPAIKIAVKTTYYHIMQELVFTVLVLIASVLAPAAPNRVVVGYSATWRDPASPPECYNYDAVTYIARAFMIPHPDGTVEPPDGYFNQTLELLARQHRVKLLMSLGGEASNADNWLSIARNEKYFNRFCADLDKLFADHGYDGIDIDWEPSATTTEDGLAFTSFLKMLRARYPNRIITTALGASDYWIGHFSWKDITDNVDFVNVMTYDYSGGWGGRADYASNLFPAGAYTPKPTLSVAEGMSNLIQNHKVSPSKLLLGMTFWPSRFAVNHIGDSFPVNGRGYSMNITYAEAMALLQTGKYTEFWDAKAAMPYMERKGGGSVVVYESPESIRRKCDYATKLGCAGVMIWHLGADLDGDHAPLMDAVAESCGVKPSIVGRDVLQREIIDRQGQLQDARLSASQLSGMSSDQLQSLLARDENQWATMQDQIWQEDAQRLQK
jgi:chitinase